MAALLLILSFTGCVSRSRYLRDVDLAKQAAAGEINVLRNENRSLQESLGGCISREERLTKEASAYRALKDAWKRQQQVDVNGK